MEQVAASGPVPVRRTCSQPPRKAFPLPGDVSAPFLICSYSGFRYEAVVCGVRKPVRCRTMMGQAPSLRMSWRSTPLSSS